LPISEVYNCKDCRYFKTCLRMKELFHGLEDYLPIYAPNSCDNFTPRMAGRCHYCGETINKPEYSWPYWVDGEINKYPVCSYRCRQKLLNNLEKE